MYAIYRVLFFFGKRAQLTPLLFALLLLLVDHRRQLVTGDSNGGNNEIYGISKISGQPITKHVSLADETKTTSLSSSSTTTLLKCPKACGCITLTVDCSNKGLAAVPRHLPSNLERLDLQGNNITEISASDLEGLRNLRTLQLMDNQIHNIEDDAFRDLWKLERLRLNNNQIRAIADNLFASTPHLVRLDMSRNKLRRIKKKTFYGAVSLKTLQLDYNEISCVDAGSVSYLKELEILTLNDNRLSTLPENTFQDLYRLRTLRISENKFNCDCRLVWLAKWLRRFPKLGQYTRCSSPSHLKGQIVADLHEQEFTCSAAAVAGSDECDGGTNDGSSFCPTPCKCVDGTVDCREKMLTKIPNRLPEDVTELRLEQNQITEIPSKAFSDYKRLRRLDLSKNLIVKVAPDAFYGLKTLTSLVMYGNKIKEVGGGLFHGLTSLQLLLLNANEITCIRKDAFRDLHSLNLLSLYDNNIKSLANGTFASLNSIQTLHLARNPFVCDCKLKWLADYLHKNPIETSGVKCESPKRMQRRKIESLRDEKLKCPAVDSVRDGDETDSAGECGVEITCPVGCTCDGSVVDCSGLHLTEMPKDVPIQTTELLLADNDITVVKSDGQIGRLPNLHKLDFKRNGIAKIEENAFEGAFELQELVLSHNRLSSVNNRMFKGLHNLKILSLYNNQISCVMPGSFDMLARLHTLNLESNPFVCNCHLAWFPEWLRRKQFTVGYVRCDAPLAIKDNLIYELSSSQFKCVNDTEPGCLGDNYCPTKCSCVGTAIQCAKLNITRVPRELPTQTTELGLQGNNITAIGGGDFRTLVDLKILDLSNNQITVLANHTFANLSRLSTLIVSYNRIRCIEKNAFAGLTALRIISLHGNDISTMPDGLFAHLHSLTHLAVGSNPLYCDCNLRWLAEWVKKDFAEPGIAKCADPAPMKDKLILNTPASAFQCKEPIREEILSKCNPCISSPCSNGAECELKTGASFLCNCPPGFHGPLCEHTIDACYGNPCRSGATCRLLEEGRFSCICADGFTGDRCELNVDDCLNNKCENNATCVDLVGRYECRCTRGFMGKYCEHRIPFCTKNYNPCQNGARCVDRFTHYTCECELGFSGENCTVNVDDCANHLCQNGGVCVDGVNEYTCKCPRGFSGKFCEIEPMVAMLYPQTSPCQHHDCKNGICFQPKGSNDYVCRCAPGYTGKRCEYLTAVTFSHNKSFAELEPLRTKPEANVTIVFSTRRTNGVILYDGQSEHLAVELFNGRLRISFDVGNYPVSTMFSFETVSDGKYHVVELLCIKKNFTLRVDGGKARSIVNEGNRDFLKLTTPLYIGGIPDEAGREAVNRWHVRNLTSFVGCMKEVWINHKLVDFLNAIKRHKISPGCSLYGEEEHEHEADAQVQTQSEAETGLFDDEGGGGGGGGIGGGDSDGYVKEHIVDDVDDEGGAAAAAVDNLNPCLGNKCHRGSQCVPQTPSDYVCKCPAGWFGKLCDQAATCKKEFAKEYYSENGCRSRKPIKVSKCQGECGGTDCCRPAKTKKRKVRLICNDGSRYTKDIDIPRRCVCTKKCFS